MVSLNLQNLRFVHGFSPAKAITLQVYFIALFFYKVYAFAITNTKDTQIA